ncbi:MAG TPA: FAD-dependent thymidylate synthase, partial [Candidatus Sulfotelmatobacter sp.]|nr:FAD-dependent thymidylate synthase [Candidatus Sulfotelmatobacter sp.]
MHYTRAFGVDVPSFAFAGTAVYTWTLLIHKGGGYDASTPMSQANNVLTMPDTSNKNPESPSGGHRSTHRSSAVLKPAVSSDGGPLSAETDKSVRPTQAEPSTEVFAVFGVEPEIQAYAMAKYSRSALSMKESLREISTQKAEKFLNTFYFQYGHRSIADLAHIALAIERLSILAAIELADEQRWDGQERSTRYQDFRKSGYYTP